MKKILDKHFDGATWWQALLGCILMAAPFIAIMAKL